MRSKLSTWLMDLAEWLAQQMRSSTPESVTEEHQSSIAKVLLEMKFSTEEARLLDALLNVRRESSSSVVLSAMALLRAQRALEAGGRPTQNTSDLLVYLPTLVDEDHDPNRDLEKLVELRPPVAEAPVLRLLSDEAGWNQLQSFHGKVVGGRRLLLQAEDSELPDAAATGPAILVYAVWNLDKLGLLLFLIHELDKRQYQIVQELGVGGLGVVLEAQSKLIPEEYVAVKVLILWRSRKGNRDLLDEARKLVRLGDHPSIVQWKKVDELQPGIYAFFMERLQGEDLRERLRRPGNENGIPPEVGMNILLEVLKGLMAAHKKDVIHLDLKPENVFLSRGVTDDVESERPRLIDFGAAQLAANEIELLEFMAPAESPSHTGNTDTLATITSIGTDTLIAQGVKRCRAATPAYASPEQLEHLYPEAPLVELDARSDIFSFGVLAYETLTGELPFRRPKSHSPEDLKAYKEKRFTSSLNQSNALNKRLHNQALVRFLRKCIDPDRDLRHLTSEQAYRQLHGIAHPSFLRQARGLLVAAALIISFFGYLYWRRATETAIAKTFVLPGKLVLDQVDHDSIVVDDKGNLDALFLGPANREIRLDLSQALEGLTSRELVLETESEARPEGWLLKVDGNLACISVPDRIPEITHARVALKIKDSARPRTSPEFDLFFLPDTWSVRSTLRHADGDRTEHKVDPREVVWISKLERLKWEHIQSIELRIQFSRPEAGQPISLVLRRDELESDLKNRNEISKSIRDSSGREVECKVKFDLNAGPETIGLELNLEALNLPSKQVVATAIVRDRAQRMVDASLPFECVSDDLKIESVLLDPRILTQFHNEVLPFEDFSIQVALSREASVTLTPCVGGVQSPQPKSGRIVTFSRAELLGNLPDSTTKSRLELDIRAEDEGVFHSDKKRAEANKKLILTLLGKDVSITFEVEGPRRDGNKLYTNQHAVTLRLNRSSEQCPACQILVKVDGNERDAVVLADPLEVVLDNLEEGKTDLVIEATRGELRQEQVFEVVRDSTPPNSKLSPEGVWGEIVWDTTRTSWPDIALLITEEPGSGELTPTDITLSLRSPDGGSRVLPTQSPTDLSKLPTPSIIAEQTGLPLPDGPYVFSLELKDFAGNEATVDLPWLLAGSGPNIDVRAPSEGRVWPEINKIFSLDITLEDPNGLAAAKLLVKRKPNAILIYSSQVHFDPESSASWAPEVPFNDLWRSSEVTVEVWASDARQVESHKQWSFRLPDTISTPPPSSLVIGLRDRAAPSSRWVYVTSSTGKYLFGGRNRKAEAVSFQEAGVADLLPVDPWPYEVLFDPSKDPGHGISDFYIGETEVTRGQFLKFVEARQDGYDNPGHWPSEGDFAEADLRGIRSKQKESLTVDPGNQNVPMTEVTWPEAYAYAHWTGMRLMSWVEWEYVVRGGEQYRVCPFDSHDGSPTKISPLPEAWPVDLETLDVTSSHAFPGVRGLVSNVREWTRTAWFDDMVSTLDRRQEELLADTSVTDDLPDSFWIVGSSFKDENCTFSCARDQLKWSSRLTHLGFRCVVSLQDLREGISEGRFILK